MIGPNPLVPQQVYDHAESVIRTHLTTGTSPTFNLDRLARVADLTDDSGPDAGPVFRFKDSTGQMRSLSSADFEVAGGIFQGLSIRVDSEREATIIVNERAPSLIGQLSPAPAGAAPAGGVSGSLAGPDVGRRIQMTGGHSFVVFGTFAPNVEAALADGWLTVREVAELRQSIGPTASSEVSRPAEDMMEILLQRDIDPKSMVQGHGRSRAVLQTWQSLQGLGDRTYQAGQGNVVNRYTSHADQGLRDVRESRNAGEHVGRMRATIARIQADPTVAPEDKRDLIRLQYLHLTMAYPDPAQRPRAVAELNLPVPSPAQQDQYNRMVNHRHGQVVAPRHLDLTTLARSMGLPDQ